MFAQYLGTGSSKDLTAVHTVAFKKSSCRMAVNASTTMRSCTYSFSGQDIVLYLTLLLTNCALSSTQRLQNGPLLLLGWTTGIPGCADCKCDSGSDSGRCCSAKTSVIEWRVTEYCINAGLDVSYGDIYAPNVCSLRTQQHKTQQMSVKDTQVHTLGQCACRPPAKTFAADIRCDKSPCV